MFKLQRYFTIFSLIAFTLIAILLGCFFRTLAFADLIEASESKNVALTQAFSNFLWPDFAPIIDQAAGLTVEELQAHPRTQELYDQVQAQLDGLSVVKVKVTDNGAGIPDIEHKRIFQKFYRVDDRLSREREGSGLGLAIVKHVMKAHSGRVELESYPGRGSTFALVLPRA